MKPSTLIFFLALLIILLILFLGFWEIVGINRLTVYVGILAPVSALTIGIIYRRSLGYDLKILFSLLVVTIISEVLSSYLSITGQSNYWVFHIFTLIEFSLLVLVIYQWQTHERVQKFLVGSVIGFFCIWLANRLLIPISPEFTPQLDNIVITIESIFFVALAVFLLVDLMKDTSASLFSHPQFWFACALLVYFAGNLLIFSYSNTLLQAEDRMIPIIAWTILASLNLIRNFCYAGTFLCSRHLKSSH